MRSLPQASSEWKKKAYVSAIDANDGLYYSFGLHEYSDLSKSVDAVVGSAAMPFVFPPKKFTMDDGSVLDLMDGGSTWNNNMVPAIEDCLAKEGIDSYSQIEVDIIVLSPWEMSTYGGSTDNALDYYNRMKDIRGFYQDTADVAEFMKAFPDLNFRYFFQPDKEVLPQLSIMSFDYETTTRPLFDRAHVDAQQIINMGPGENFKKLLAFHNERQAQMESKMQK